MTAFAGVALIVIAAIGIWALRRATIADMADDGPDHVTGGLAIFLPAYALCAMAALGLWLIAAGTGAGL
ncbi:hypothetical protein ACTTAI_16190 [Rhodobacter capsulatus]|uniref:hypothetical protein n=1 Tax=Rhodobacter capsulatus TaxID=1061 RepID=UPI004027CAD2